MHLWTTHWHIQRKYKKYFVVAKVLEHVFKATYTELRWVNVIWVEVTLFIVSWGDVICYFRMLGSYFHGKQWYWKGSVCHVTCTELRWQYPLSGKRMTWVESWFQPAFMELHMTSPTSGNTSSIKALSPLRVILSPSSGATRTTTHSHTRHTLRSLFATQSYPWYTHRLWKGQIHSSSWSAVHREFCAQSVDAVWMKSQSTTPY